MKISEIKTLQEISKEYDIPYTTLRARLYNKNFRLIEDVDYKKLEGARQPILIAPTGINKLLRLWKVEE